MFTRPIFKQVPKSGIGVSYEVRNKVSLVRGGKQYFDLLEEMIVNARESVHLQVYIFDEDDTGSRIAGALMDAALRGVEVYMLVDGYASKDLSGIFINNLIQAGIHFRRFEPILRSKGFYFGRRLHHKVVVIDHYRSLVAGLNISDRYNDTMENAWLDFAIYAEGEVASSLARICARRFRTKSPAAVESKPLSIPVVETDCAVRIRINDWVGQKREITNSYLEMFKAANSHVIVMSPYFLPGELMRRRIKQATKRGVRVQVIQAGISDIAMSKYAERYMYRWLFRNKVEIYEYQKTVLHGKIAVCDGRWSTVGSYNLNNLSAYASIELNLEVDNATFAKEVEDQLTGIIKSDCVQVTEAAYEKTNTFQHLLQRGAYNLLRVLLFLFTFYFKQFKQKE